MEIVTILWTVAKVVLGIGFVIFWHELGHFALAKWNGVFVKTFSIGFPPRLFRFRHNETDYVIGATPLGGYVRMLGDEEGEAKDPDSPALSDPRAYHNKSVWARMAIISAGVVLNVILGFACYIGAYKIGGLPESPAILGDVAAGGPAYRAGLRPGDEILAIDGKTDVVFGDLLNTVAHSVNDQVVDFVVKREGSESPINITVEPVPDPVRKIPTIRVNNAASLQLASEIPPYIEPPGAEGPPSAPFKPGDLVRAVQPPEGLAFEPKSSHQFEAFLDEHRAEPLVLTLARPRSKAGVKTAVLGNDKETIAAEPVTITLPPTRFVDLGFWPTLGKVVAVRKGSPAESAGFRVGDRMTKVDGQDRFDPLRLPELFHDAKGRAVEVEVERSLPGDQTESAMLTVTPASGWLWNSTISRDEPLNIDGLGLAVEVKPIVSVVRDGSPAAKAGVKPGQVVESITLYETDPREPKAEPREIAIDLATKGTYNFAFDQMQQVMDHDVLVKLKDRKDPLTLRPEPVADWHDPRRGLGFGSLAEPLPAMTWPAAIEKGTAATVTSIGSMYRLIQSLFQRRVDLSNLAGPIRIAGVAYTIAGRNLGEFVQFIGLLSINLAVVNFLPIPPLDGGKMVFLIGEAIRGRPVPDSWQIAITNVGVLFVLCLMVFVLFQDVWMTWFFAG